MDDFDRYLEERTEKDAEFRKLWTKGSAELAYRKAIIGARLAAGLSQADLAKRIGTPESVVTRAEVGASRPSLDLLLKIAATLKVRFELDRAGIRIRQPDGLLGG
jgi:ribosome-binding protein aMBF1 (putative translation factor)